MSAAKGAKPSVSKPMRQIDVYLVDRMAAIKAIASGAVQETAATIRLDEFKRWALDTNQPEGIINGVKIVERKGDNTHGQAKG